MMPMFLPRKRTIERSFEPAAGQVEQTENDQSRGAQQYRLGEGGLGSSAGQQCRQEYDHIVDQPRKARDQEIDHAGTEDLFQVHQPVTRDADDESQREADGGGEHLPGCRSGAKGVAVHGCEVEGRPDRE